MYSRSGDVSARNWSGHTPRMSPAVTSQTTSPSKEPSSRKPDTAAAEVRPSRVMRWNACNAASSASTVNTVLTAMPSSASVVLAASAAISSAAIESSSMD